MRVEKCTFMSKMTPSSTLNLPRKLHCSYRSQEALLTLGAGGSFPAFLADAIEGVAVDHTGASVLTWVGQTAAVLGCRGTTREVRTL